MGGIPTMESLRLFLNSAPLPFTPASLAILVC